MRASRHLDATDPRVRIAALLARLPSGAVLGGWAALYRQGVVALDGRAGPAGRRLLPILVHVGTRGHVRPRPGLAVDRSRLSDEDLIEANGVRLTTATRAVFDVLCRDGAEEGLVAGDAAWAAGVTSGDALRRYVESHPGVRGVPSARLAVPLLDPRSRSLPETRLRWVWVVEAGLPVPQVNRGILTEDGVLLGEADLLDPDVGLVGEYDGSTHRELVRHTSDNIREEAFESVNLRVVRATAIDVWPRRAELVGRLQSAYALAGAGDRRQDRWCLRRPW